jgi:LDH2 family malate/lactate/ureidoglycolate dehydrogenase
MLVPDIKRFCGELLVAYGVPADEAATIADSLVKADMRGMGSHGVMRLPVYIKRIKAGLMKAQAAMTVEKDCGAALVLDADFSFGQVAGERGMALAIERAKEFGIGACLVKNSGHFGMAARFGEMAAAEKMVGIVLANTTPLMPPTGGAEKKIGNNPLAIVAPTKGDPIVVDMALSAVAMGKIFVAKNKGEKIPLDWATDRDGAPTDDPAKAIDGGLLLPMAGPKGYSLAVAAEILTGVIAGAFAWQLPSLYNLTAKQSVAHFFIAVNIGRLLDYDTYLENIEALKAGLKGARRLPGVKDIFLPGEIEQNREKHAAEIGLPAGVVAELNDLAREAGVSPLS